MLLWKNLKKLSEKTYIERSIWSIPACHLVDICTAHSDDLSTAVEAAAPVIRDLNTVFSANRLHIVATSKKRNAIRDELRDFAANIGVAFMA